MFELLAHMLNDYRAFTAIRNLVGAEVLANPVERAKVVVVTHSSGNHAGAVACSARDLGLKAIVVMPEVSLKNKIAAVRNYGAEIAFCANSEVARAAKADEVIKKVEAEGRRCLFIPAYDSPHTVAGQGTAALELLEDWEDLEAIIVPVGGGGCISGTAIVAKAHDPSIKIIGVEPQYGDDAKRSMIAGERLLNEKTPDTVADGARTTLGKTVNWPIIKELVDLIVTVKEEDICASTLIAMQRAKLVVEPTGAMPIAALFNEEFKTYAQDNNLRKVALILTGGNIDIDGIPHLAKLASASDIPKFGECARDD
eukprot:GHVN01096115.1.p1 GENE.GHVN01096115.1~~GHVN01096115.1.p1  ORF type:complete len:312 (+),score=31.59 GHVN01096115.1:318-1253(+)